MGVFVQTPAGRMSVSASKFRDKKVTRKNLCKDKDFVELSGDELLGELSGPIPPKHPSFTEYCPQIIQRILWECLCESLAEKEQESGKSPAPEISWTSSRVKI